MDKVLFVKNVRDICKLRSVKPTVACRESGVGSSFINNIEARGQVPSVEKVQMLATYLGVTTSELLGEEKEPAPAGDRPLYPPKYDSLTPSEKEIVDRLISELADRRGG